MAIKERLGRLTGVTLLLTTAACGANSSPEFFVSPEENPCREGGQTLVLGPKDEALLKIGSRTISLKVRDIDSDKGEVSFIYGPRLGVGDDMVLVVGNLLLPFGCVNGIKKTSVELRVY